MYRMFIITWHELRTKLLFVLLLSGASLSVAYGQESDSLKFSYINFYLTSQLAVPSKEFREVINNDFGNAGVGIGTGLVFSPLLENRSSPFLIGLDFGYFTYGQEKTAATTTAPPLKTTHNVFTWNAIGRLRPKYEQGSITPFIDGLLGLKLYNTKTKINKDIVDFIFNDDQREVINNVKDTGVNYGLGVGFYTNPKRRSNPGFTLRVLYLWGDEVNYVVRNSVALDPDGFVTFDTDRANTSMLIIQLGIIAIGRKTLVGTH